MPASTRIVFRYCKLCRWMLRTTWMVQELLTTFDEDIAEVSLQPGTGGVFEVWVNDNLVWERKRDGGFPDIKELKRRVRDQIDPHRSLGHSDHSASPS